MDLETGIFELYRKVATSLPPDVEEALRGALKRERGRARYFLEVILENIRIARAKTLPLCQDTGIPIFFVEAPPGISEQRIREAITRATRRATQEIPLRPNAVEPVTNTNSDDNTGREFPIIYFRSSQKNNLRIDLLLKGGGSENVSQIYKLPEESLGAGRDLDGVRRCVLDAINRAQGRGCPPYVVGVAVGGSVDQVSLLGKRLLLRRLDEETEAGLSEFETRLLRDINSLGIGPFGLGGKTTALAAHFDYAHRHPATYIVAVTISCWAHRRGRLIWR